jgi:hypothetical protein
LCSRRVAVSKPTPTASALNAPIVLDVDTAHRLLHALQRAIDERDILRIQLNDIDGADPDDFKP